MRSSHSELGLPVLQPVPRDSKDNGVAQKEPIKGTLTSQQQDLTCVSRKPRNVSGPSWAR